MSVLQSLERFIHDQTTEVIVKKVTQTVQQHITAREKDKLQFDENVVHRILSNIKSGIAEFMTTESPNLFNEFTVNLSVYLCLVNISRFQKMHGNNKTSNQRLAPLQAFFANIFWWFRKLPSKELRAPPAEEPPEVEEVVKQVLCKHFQNQPNIQQKVRERMVQMQQNNQQVVGWMKGLDNNEQIAMKQILIQ